jgi:phosphoserine aminotransferase
MIQIIYFGNFAPAKTLAVMDEARALALELLGLEGKGYQALFLAGGASLEF